MAKEEYTILKTEEVQLNFYAVRSKDGKWLRKKGYGGSGESWVEDISIARIWGKPGPAKAQITWWATNYPKYGVPDLVRITTGKCEFLDQTERVEKSKKKKELEDARRSISNLEYDINNYIDRGNRDKAKISTMKKELELRKEKLENLKNGK